MNILLAPHNDDECLFAAYTIMREKPLVIIITDGYTHIPHGVTPDDRRRESIEAMKALDTPVVFLGMDDRLLDRLNLKDRLRGLNPDKVFAPAILENGNNQHNTIGAVALDLWNDKVVKYFTYTKDNLKPRGDIEIKPTIEEMELKHLALSKYLSQLRLNRAHFDAVWNQSEYYVK